MAGIPPGGPARSRPARTPMLSNTEAALLPAGRPARAGSNAGGGDGGASSGNPGADGAPCGSDDPSETCGAHRSRDYISFGGLIFASSGNAQHQHQRQRWQQRRVDDGGGSRGSASSRASSRAAPVNAAAAAGAAAPESTWDAHDGALTKPTCLLNSHTALRDAQRAVFTVISVLYSVECSPF